MTETPKENRSMKQRLESTRTVWATNPEIARYGHSLTLKEKRAE